MDRKVKIARDFLKAIETGDSRPLAYVGKYTQHNLAIPDGLEGLQKVLSLIPPGSAEVNTVRAFSDGDYVVTHTEYNFFGPKVGIDVFRMDGDGKIQEHWDNLTEKSKTLSPSLRSQTDGETEIQDVEKTATNKTLAENFVRDILVQGNLARIGEYLNPQGTDDFLYRQHNPLVGDGVKNLKGALQYLAEQGSAIVYEKIQKVLGCGNFVLVMSEGKWGTKPTAYFDLFRIKDGKIVEHWDVIQEIPPREQWANNNGKF